MFKIRSYSFAISSSMMATVFLLMFAWLVANQTSHAQTAFDCSAVTEIPASECSALVALYNNTDGANWERNTGWLETTTPCSWQGVECYNGHLDLLSLNDAGLSGAIPPEIGDLVTLYALNLSGNQLTSLPAEIGDMHLRHLLIGNNQLTSLPVEISDITILSTLHVQGNQLTSIPAEIGNLSDLTILALNDNQLTHIPAEIGTLPNLTILNVDGNQLSTLPDTIGNLSDTLELFDVSDNPLTSWPSSLFDLILQNFVMENVCEASDAVAQTWFDATPTGLYYEDGEMIYDSRTHVFCSDTAIAGTIWYENSEDAALSAAGDPQPNFHPSEDVWLADVTVIATNIETSATVTTTTDSTGRYAFKEIPFGDYELALDWNNPPRDQNGGSLSYYWPRGENRVTVSAETPNAFARDFVYALPFESTPGFCGNPELAIPVAECSALISFYESTGGYNWTDEAQTGWLTNDPPCEWEGVSCVDGHVDSIVLNEAGLSGDIPAAIANLTALESIVLNDNNITSLPYTIGQMSSLRVIILNRNQLTSIPAEIGNLTDLDALTLGENQLSAVPSTLSNMTNLRNLSLASNQFTSFPPELLDLTNMVNLQLDGNQLTSIPAGIDALSALERLTLGNNQITSFPSTVGNFSQLLVLGLNGNQATILPAEIGNLPRLSGLNVSDNPLTTWPGSFADLTILYMLGMDNVCEPHQPQLQAWIDGIGDVTGRGGEQCVDESADFSCANVTEIPTSECEALVALYNSMDGANWNVEEGADWLQTTTPCNWDGVICNNGSITQLSLGGMGLSGAIPPEIDDFQNLTHLQINDNRITSLPAEIGNLSNLDIFYISNNPLTGWPSSVSNLLLLNFVLDNVCEPSDPALQTWLDTMPTGDFYLFADPLYESRTGVLCSEAAVAGKIWIESAEDIANAPVGIPSPTFNPFFDEWLADITVNLVDLTTGATFTTTTGSDGRYTFRNVPFGDYEVTVDESSLPAGRNATHYAPHGPTLVTVAADDLNTLGKDFVYSADADDEDIPLAVDEAEMGAEGAEGMVFLPFVVMAGATIASVRNVNAK